MIIAVTANGRTMTIGRLIDIGRLCDDLTKRWSIADKKKEDLIRAVMADVVTPIVVSQPTVDAVPVVHGRWVHHPEIGWGITWLCSECGEKTVEAIMGEPRYKFCPMCGADMRKDGDGSVLS